MTFYKYWEEIPWLKLEAYVLKIQRQIFRAQKRGQRRRVRWLQRKLIHSRANLLLSIRRVTQKNRGKKTAGIDDITALTNKEREDLFHELVNTNLNNYNPPPVKRVKIKKKNGKKRPLGIPTIKDRVLQNVAKNALEPQWEAIFEPTTYGFRPKRSVHDALARIHNDLYHGKRLFIFEGDFKSCFDNLDHDFLLERLKDFPAVELIRKWLKAGCMENGNFLETKMGTPQGSIISPLLTNIALYGMSEALGITYKKRHYKKDGETHLCHNTYGKYRLSFYADDFVIMCETKEDAEKIPELLAPYLKERGLTLQEEKTKITNLYDGFDFLGFNVRGIRSKQSAKKPFKLIIQPSKESITEAKHKIKDVFKKCTGGNVGLLIHQLNPVIRGIANYWSRSCSKEIFNEMDCYIWFHTRKFLKRLHPNKSWKWIKEKYFKPDYTGQSKDRWILTDPESRTYQLKKMSWTPIRYHKMIAHKSSPFDDKLVKYFQRRAIKDFNQDNIYTRQKLAKRQCYVCPFCDKPITDPDIDCDVHHVEPRCVGGSESLDNKQLAHHTCHIEYHKVFPAKYGKPTKNNIRAFRMIYQQRLWEENYA